MSTPKNLVIVESPAKAKTIEKFLGPDYLRHVELRPHTRFEKEKFQHRYRQRFQPDLQKYPKTRHSLSPSSNARPPKPSTVWLASDEDREGEAIAWHLYEVLGLKPENTRRIVFHEITKNAILHAIEHPRSIDLARVDAQQGTPRARPHRGLRVVAPCFGNDSSRPSLRPCAVGRAVRSS